MYRLALCEGHAFLFIIIDELVNNVLIVDLRIKNALEINFTINICVR